MRLHGARADAQPLRRVVYAHALGREATTYWASADYLSTAFDVTYRPERYVRSGKIITAAGVSAGIDMALALAARIAGDEVAQAIQLGIEYDPQPPFDSGSLGKAPPSVRELVESARDQYV